MSDENSVCVCGHPYSRHSPRLGYDNGCRTASICGCQHFIAADCLCGEINARHCPVHNDAALGGRQVSDEQVQRRVWETRCPELLAECEALRAALREFVAAADALTALSFALPANETERAVEHVAALRMSRAVEAARAALGEADDE